MNLYRFLFLAFAALLISPNSFAACSEHILEINIATVGELTDSDCRVLDVLDGKDESIVDIYKITLKKSTSVTISLTSSQLDPFLSLYDFSLSNLIAKDDESGQDKGALISDVMLNPGTYKILANSATHAVELGTYEIEITTLGAMLGDPDYCSVNQTCTIGQGDCDSDRECSNGLVCNMDVGAKYGFPSNIDVCENQSVSSLLLGHPDFCKLNGSCEAGQGDCDSDQECANGLVCNMDVGAKYGFPLNIDVCENRENQIVNTLPAGHRDFCLLNGSCDAGQGDCDSDQECATGLVCVSDVGADYGFPSNVDVCERSQ